MAEIYQMVSENPESTVVAEFQPGYRSAAQYQSEAEMEQDFIQQLTRQGYDYLSIKSEKELINNLRQQIEKLNTILFDENEWDSFLREHLANPNHDIVEKTRTIQEDYIKAWTRPDGTKVNIYLIDKENIHNNSFRLSTNTCPRVVHLTIAMT